MGVDCTMYLYNNETKEMSEELIAGIRNSAWFDDISCNRNNFPIEYIEKEELPDKIQNEFEKYEDNYYGLRRLNVLEYAEWIEKYKPSLDAGWCTKREAWEYRTRNIIPDLQLNLSKTDIVEDMEFIEVENKYNLFDWLLEKVFNITKHQKTYISNYDLYFWFDC